MFIRSSGCEGGGPWNAVRPGAVLSRPRFCWSPARCLLTDPPPPPPDLGGSWDYLSLHSPGPGLPGKNLTVPGTDVSARKLPNTIPRSPDIPEKGVRSPGFEPLASSVGRANPTGTVAFTVLCRAAAGDPGGRPWGSAGPLGSMRTRPLGLAPTRRGPSPAPAPHPRIADVHNGGGTRGSQRVVNAQSAAAALQSDTGAARPRLGLELGPGSRGRWRKRRRAPGPSTGWKWRAAGPTLLGARLMRRELQGRGGVSRRGGPMAGQTRARGGPLGKVGGSSALGGSLAGRAGALQPKAAGVPHLPRPHGSSHTQTV